MIAKPIAASAAATVKINSEKICPVRSPRKKEKDTKFMFTANKINSIDIRIIIIFFLLRNIPNTPIKNNKDEALKLLTRLGKSKGLKPIK